MTRSVRSSSVTRLLAVGALAAVVVALILTTSSSGGSRQVKASFEQVNGLIEGGRVTIGGIAVGEVEDIRLGSDGYPLVRMSVNDDIRIGSDARARVRPLSLAGEVSRVVELAPERGATLSEGAVIPRSHTDQVEEFDQALSALDPRTRAEVRRVFQQFDRGFAGRGGDIERTLRHSAGALDAAADTLAQLDADGAALRTLVHEGSTVVAAIKRDPSSLGSFADRAADLFETTGARQAQLEEVASGTAAGVREARLAFDRLSASVDNLRKLVRTGRPGVRELRAIAPDLRAVMRAGAPAFRQTRALVTAAPADLRRLTPLLRTAKPAFEALTPALRRATPMFNQLRVRLPDAFGFFSNWADFTSNYDANGHGGRVGLLFTNPPTNRIGSGDAVPGRLQAPFLRDPGVLEGEPWKDYESTFLEAGK